MARGGRIKTDEGVDRKCLVTQESGPKAGLIRFVTGPDNQVVPDILGKLPGRGYYVTSERPILEQAVQKKVFARGAKMQVTVQENLVDEIERQLAKRVIDLLAISRKAGKAVTGFEKVKGWLAEGRAKILLQASDGSERGKNKLWTPEGGRFFGCLTSQELGLAFGRGHAIHGALSAGGLTERVVEEAARLRGLREAS
ncbi:MAG: RNA-binding protein [Planktomarina sp.]